MKIVVTIDTDKGEKSMPLSWYIKWLYRDIAFHLWLRKNRYVYRFACWRIMKGHYFRTALSDIRMRRRVR